MKTIGMIGGMGPEATVDLYSKIIQLTPAAKDQEHLHVIINSYAQIPDRTAYIMGGDVDPAPFLIEAALKLEKAGAQGLCMPCNTAHYFLPEIEKHLSIPFISIIDSAVNQLKIMPQKPSRIVVMATSGTRSAKVYETKLENAGFTVLPIPEEIEKKLMACIYEGVKKGKTQEYVPLFQDVLDRLAALEPDAMVAACTELPLLTKYTRSDVPVVDATLELAKACVAFAME